MSNVTVENLLDLWEAEYRERYPEKVHDYGYNKADILEYVAQKSLQTSAIIQRLRTAIDETSEGIEELNLLGQDAKLTAMQQMELERFRKRKVLLTSILKGE